MNWLPWRTAPGAAPAAKSEKVSSRTGPDTTATPPRPAAPAPPPPPATSPTHLIVLVNGLSGSRHNWTVIAELLSTHLDPTATHIHVSSANEYTATYRGIDTCGARLADEIAAVAADNPALRRLSVVGHSMGGLVARYAVGQLYDPDAGDAGCIAGLRPTHFVALATPHLGCEDAPGEAQVPLLAWTAGVPAVGGALARAEVPGAAPQPADLGPGQDTRAERDAAAQGAVARAAPSVRITVYLLLVLYLMLTLMHMYIKNTFIQSNFILES